MKPFRLLAVVAALAIAPFCLAATPRDFTGVVVKVSDGDTFDVRRSDGAIIRVRLHYADAPEVAHNRNEVDQPLGEDAKSYGYSLLANEAVAVHVVGISYDRYVGDIARVSDGLDAASDLVARGYAMLDKRFKPPQSLVAVEASAKAKHLGIWADSDTVPPWQWRQSIRAQRIARQPK